MSAGSDAEGTSRLGDNRSLHNPAPDGHASHSHDPVCLSTVLKRWRSRVPQCPPATRAGKKIPISRAADSAESEPWTRFSESVLPRSPRIVPGGASAGFVAPIMVRTICQVSGGPSTTSSSEGDRVMKVTSSP